MNTLIEKENNKRIAKNTIYMYLRMGVMLVIALFTSRVNLKMLGVEDYGIYGVIGGVVSMFTIFSNSLSAAIQRFISFELGKGSKERLMNIFSMSVTVMFSLAIILMICADFFGIWFINNKMVIPAERIYAAHWVLHCSVITFGISLVSVPYNAMIVAYERMSAFAYISIYEAVSKLIICYMLYISPVDRLITWAVLLAILQISVRLIYGFYCKRNFETCVFRLVFDKSLLIDITKYAGWSTFGLVALTCYTQGLNILLNIFFGPVVNAARSISVQVQSAVQGFSTNFQVAMNPQIIKSYAQHDLHRMHSLIFTGSRFCFYLLFILSLPIILETPYILRIWLGEYPEHTASFIRLILGIITFDSSLGGPISTAQTATGNIKIYQIVVGGIMLLILPVSYIVLRIWDTPPESIYYVYLSAVIIAHISRMFIIRDMINLSLSLYAKEVLVPITKVLFCSLPIPILLHVYLDNASFSSFVVVGVTSLVSVGLSVFLFGLNTDERKMIINKFRFLFRRYERH